MWRDFQAKTLIHNVFVTLHYCVVVVTVFGNLYGKKITKLNERSAPPGELLVNSIPLHEWEPDSVHSSLMMIMRCNTSFVTSDVTFHDALLVRISIKTHYKQHEYECSRQLLFIPTSGSTIKDSSKISMLWCVPSHLFWLRNTGMLYEMTHWRAFMPVLFGSVWNTKVVQRRVFVVALLWILSAKDFSHFLSAC